MATSFMLLGLVAFLYYLDARKNSVIDMRAEMLKTLYEIRQNTSFKVDKFNVKLDDAAKYTSPSFRQYEDRFELVACANTNAQNKVCVITAAPVIAEQYLDDITHKIMAAYLLVFIPFLAFGYFLARLSLIPLKNAYGALVSFNQDIIHDLKTPITTIQINGELLDAKSKPFSRVINATKTLESLYLNLESYLRTGKHLKFEKINLQTLLDEKREIYASLYPQAVFSYEIEPLFIETDKINFIRIVDNIIANGIKHGTRIPEIRIWTANNRLFIADNGAGIAHPERIFERHYCETPYVKGFGLGLNIVKRLSEQLDIPIQITTSKEGTIFELDLAKITTL
ncbi:MAG: HAMP domain-containing histidine kinase [Campylobacterales bacterium]|nr:HAMP domain-containing histidine kinase [Campylobacterales bacterium]